MRTATTWCRSFSPYPTPRSDSGTWYPTRLPESEVRGTKSPSSKYSKGQIRHARGGASSHLQPRRACAAVNRPGGRCGSEDLNTYIVSPQLLVRKLHPRAGNNSKTFGHARRSRHQLDAPGDRQGAPTSSTTPCFICPLPSRYVTFYTCWNRRFRTQNAPKSLQPIWWTSRAFCMCCQSLVGPPRSRHR